MSALFLKVLHMSVCASWLVLAVLLLRLCLRRAPKWFNVLLWGIVAVRLVFPFSVESPLSLLPRTEAIRPAITTVQTQPAQISSAAAAGGSAAPAQSWLSILAWVWLAGAAALLLYTMVSTLRLRHRVREAVRLRGNIYQSERIDSPFVLGTIRPRIYLPYRMDSRDRQHVIAHEQAHMRRGDHLWKPLGFLLLTIHWFNPVMWLSYVLLCRDIELACDETVIRELGCEQRADYMQALVSCSVNRRRIAACPLAFGEIGVKERVKSVMNYKKPTFWIILLAIIACIVLAVCFLTDPVASRTEEPADPVVYNTEATPDPADTAPEEPAQPTEQDDNLSAEQEAMKDKLSAAEEADNSALDELIGKAVLDHYADAVQPGQIHVESHVVLAEDRRGTETVTVYLLVLQEIYSTDGESLTLENGSYIPTAITFSLSTSSGAVTEYWDSLLYSRFLPLRQLREDDRREHDRAAEKLPCRERLAEQQPAEQCREDRFQAHEQGSQRGLHVALADDLERVRHASGEDTRIYNGPPALQNGIPVRRFKQKHTDRGQRGADQKLYAAQTHAVHMRHDCADIADMDREQHRAAKRQQIAA